MKSVVPVIGIQETMIFDRQEDLARAYLYWTPHRHWAVSAEAEYSRFKRSAEEPSVTQGRALPKVETVILPLAVRYFHPLGFFAEVGGTFVHQEVDLEPISTFTRDSDDFFLLDVAVGYRFPKRRGIIRLEARNLLDEDFLFQDLNTQTAGESVTPRLIPEPTVFVRATFAFN